MSVDRRLLNWGVFLVLLGGVPLAVAQGWIPRDTVVNAWELWPFILIGAGIGLLLRRTPLRGLGGIIVAATFGTILGAILAVGVGGIGSIGIGNLGCGAAEANAPQILHQQGTFEGGAGTVLLSANCSSIRVVTASGHGWDVTVRGADSARPTVEASAGALKVRSPARPLVVPFGSQRATWDTTLGSDPQLGLLVDVNAGDADFDLAGATVTGFSFTGNAIGTSRLDLSAARVAQLDVIVNAGDLRIALPSAASLRGTLQGNAASVRLCAAPGVGLRLVVDGNLTASNNYADAGLTKAGNAWVTEGYAGATTKIDLETTGSAVSFTLNPKDGCR
jgi:hypothetical protein